MSVITTYRCDSCGIEEPSGIDCMGLGRKTIPRGWREINQGMTFGGSPYRHYCKSCSVKKREQLDEKERELIDYEYEQKMKGINEQIAKMQFEKMSKINRLGLYDEDD